MPVSDRLLLLQIDSKSLPINIIQVYAPTADQEEEEVRELYAQIEALKKQISKRELLIVMGDFNAKIGKGRSGEHIGPFGLGVRNERGDILDTFASDQDLIILNT